MKDHNNSLRIVRKFSGFPYIEQKFESIYKQNIRVDLEPKDLINFDEKDAEKIDLLITIGGDGTVLWALQYFKASVPPIISFGKV